MGKSFLIAANIVAALIDGNSASWLNWACAGFVLGLAAAECMNKRLSNS